MHVVATAGHVDHGKSTLLRALTGMEPDRFEEERRRGLTLDLGFVWADLGHATGRRTVAFVDVPGHERFVGTMLAGAGAVRAVLFVVAADDGWSAQSQEHLDILDLLGVRTGVVAITKAAVAGETRALDVAADVETRLATTSVRGAPIVVTDALAGIGLNELVDALVGRVAALPTPPTAGRARLWIDRSFTIAGTGTVVTGTLAGGDLAVGKPAALLPAGQPTRVRGLHALGAPRREVAAGDRVAVNLTGVRRDAVGRGDALVTGAPSPERAWVVTDRFDGWVRALPPHHIGRRGAWRFHTGSAAVACVLRPLLGDPIGPDGPGYVRIHLDRPLPLQARDRFVLRETGRGVTAGGGEVVDPDPAAVRGPDQRLERADLLDVVRRAPTDGARITALVRAAGGIRPAAATLAAAGAADGDPTRPVVEVAGTFLAPEVTARWRDDVLAAAAEQRGGAAPGPGPTRASLTATVNADERLVGAFLDHLVAAGDLARRGMVYAVAAHVPALEAAQERRVADLLATLAEQPLAPPRLEAAAAAAGLGYQDLQELLQRGVVVRCGEYGFAPGTIADAVARLRRLHAEVGAFTAAQAKEAWGTTRRIAIPLLEHLDAVGATVLCGNLRRLGT